MGGILLGTAPRLDSSFMSGSTHPHSHPVFVQSLSLPFPTLLSPLPWPPSLSPPSFPIFGPMGVAGLSGQTAVPRHGQAGGQWLQLCAEGAGRGKKLEGSGEGPRPDRGRLFPLPTSAEAWPAH